MLKQPWKEMGDGGMNRFESTGVGLGVGEKLSVSNGIVFDIQFQIFDGTITKPFLMNGMVFDVISSL